MEVSGFSAIQTIFTAALVAFITSILVPTYWTPYINFKQELIATNRYLQLHSNILTNKFQKGTISQEFEKEVYDAQYDIRTSWVNLESKYLLIPSLERSVLIEVKKLPTKKEMNDISGDLLTISNSMIVFDKNNSHLAEIDFQNREKSILKVQTFIKQYGIS